MKIFVCIESYLPGTLGGGPVRALANLIEHLGNEHEFFIFTRNHDYLSAEPYPNIQPNAWQPQAGASVYYCDSDQAERALAEQLLALQPDWIYLNGALPPLTRACLALRQKDAGIAQIPVLLAPHGNLSASALAHHRFRKQGWLLYAKTRGLYRDVIWHAASEREADQIRASFGAAAQIREVPMAPKREVGRLESGNVESKEPGTKNSGTGAQKAPLLDEEGWAAQRVGVVPDSALSSQVSDLSSPNSPLHLVYFGRLSPEKNLPFAFLLLKQFARTHPDRAVIYDLIGSGSDAYEAKLQKLAARLPATVQVNFIGQLSPEALALRLSGLKSLQAPSNLSTFPLSPSSPPKEPSHLPTFPPSHTPRYCAMLMPSLTENFSYTVLESLQAGIPVLISDQTPWRDLEAKGLGWDLSLEDISAWEEALRFLCGQACVARRDQSDCIRRYAQQWTADYSDRAMLLFGANVR